jgi:hypothetical protein
MCSETIEQLRAEISRITADCEAKTARLRLTERALKAKLESGEEDQLRRWREVGRALLGNVVLTNEIHALLQEASA